MELSGEGESPAHGLGEAAVEVDVEGDASFVELSAPVDARGVPEDGVVSTLEVIGVGAAGDTDDGLGSPGSQIGQGQPNRVLGSEDAASGKGGKPAVPRKGQHGAGALPSRELEGARAQLPWPPRQRTAQIV